MKRGRSRRISVALACLLALGPYGRVLAAPRPSLSPRIVEATTIRRALRTHHHRIVVSLDLRNRDALEAFLVAVQDPASPRYQQFLSQDEFDALYAPTPQQEEAVVRHLRRHGFRITERYPNRLLVAAVGSVGAVESAFGVEMHDVTVRHRRHYMANREPSFPPDIAPAIVGVIGLDDLVTMRSHVRVPQQAVAPSAVIGASCCHLGPNDLFNFYDNTVLLNGAGETIVIAGAFAWRDSDNTGFNSQWGLPQLPAGSGQVCTGAAGSVGCRFSLQNSIEIALDAEYAHGTAPQARILNYMAASTSLTDFTRMYNRIVIDNPGHVVSTSWGACEATVSVATQQTDDNIVANANAIGQSWLAASGDNGSRDCNARATVDNPANSPHVVGVGGTTPRCSAGLTAASPGCAGYGSETGWSGSGGGVSQLFPRPTFQTGCGVPAGTQRLVPDVALEADTTPGSFVLENGTWFVVGGTSGAAPQWAGLVAQLDQKGGGIGLGNPGARLYGLCGTTALHDITSGSNGDFTAGVGFDLVTGLGSAEASVLLGAAAVTTTSSTSTTTTSVPTTTTTTLVPTTTTTSSSSTSTSVATVPPTTTTTVAVDRVTVTRAEYDLAKHVLRLEATSTSTTTTLRAFVTASGELIGTLTNNGAGRYGAQLSWPVNPQNVTVRSALGGVTTAGVTAN
ncbi:MAG TPA: S53 family serine peptidase [Candidatus Nitrosopolaris sp.]|nr:S53 family serine peptidase [Candidatus Nitrosopolaris sp.]